MVTFEDILRAQQAQGLATIMGTGTANPPNCINQSTYPDYYFRVTNSEHKIELKEKFRRLCENSMIKKRNFCLSEAILKQNPSIGQFDAPSLNARQDIVLEKVPKLGMEAATKAIESWGQPKSNITHLVFCTNSGVDMPGADCQLTKLLGLGPYVKRFMLYNQGWYAGGTALRLAKDLAENNKDARVLVVCSEISAGYFHGPSDAHPNVLAGMSLFGDGAAALIVGSDPTPEVEKPIFELVLAIQTTIPDSHADLTGHLGESGLVIDFTNEIFGRIPDNIEEILVEAFKSLGGVSHWNSIFWVVHPGSSAVLDQVELKMGLEPDKLWVSRHVLSEHGNMSSAGVLFALEEMRKKSTEKGLEMTGDGLEWGVMLGFGHGITIETLVLRSLPC